MKEMVDLSGEFGIDFADLFELDEETVRRSVVSEADGSEDERSVDRFHEVERARERLVFGRREVAQSGGFHI